MPSLVVIPARLAATRFPNKPLAPINGKPMIVHCLERAQQAGCGPVLVAAGDEEIVAAVESAGGLAVMTDPGHPSGSDRIWEAVSDFDPDGDFDVIINVQGDLPTLDPAIVRACAEALSGGADIATPVAEITRPEERDDPNVVKAFVGFETGSRQARALTFTRATAPSGDGPLYHHIGLYAYRRNALERFVSLPPGVLERRERLEQLRALEAGLRIDAVLVDTVPLGVDTPEDLARAEALLRG